MRHTGRSSREETGTPVDCWTALLPLLVAKPAWPFLGGSPSPHAVFLIQRAPVDRGTTTSPSRRRDDSRSAGRWRSRLIGEFRVEAQQKRRPERSAHGQLGYARAGVAAAAVLRWRIHQVDRDPGLFCRESAAQETSSLSRSQTNRCVRSMRRRINSAGSLSAASAPTSGVKAVCHLARAVRPVLRQDGTCRMPAR